MPCGKHAAKVITAQKILGVPKFDAHKSLKSKLETRADYSPVDSLEVSGKSSIDESNFEDDSLNGDDESVSKSSRPQEQNNDEADAVDCSRSALHLSKDSPLLFKANICAYDTVERSKEPISTAAMMSLLAMQKVQLKFQEKIDSRFGDLRFEAQNMSVQEYQKRLEQNMKDQITSFMLSQAVKDMRNIV